MLLSIIKDPNLILRQKAEEARDINTEEVQNLIENMKDTLEESRGVGLAAPQVGESLRIVIIAVKDKKMVLVNPKIIKKSWGKELGEEGCLSIPGVFGLVKRSKKITLKFLDSAGEKRKFIAEGLLARIIQHEIDHLDGILFIDKVKRFTQTIVG